MSRSTAVRVAAVCGSVLGAAGMLAYAGPLNPPGGAVASSYKTLAEVEPRIAINSINTPGDADGTPSLYKITQPGSYYLTGNLTGVTGKIGIEIVANGVTLDLNGFEMLGVTGTLDAVRVSVAGVTNVAVCNGSVRDWDADGVDVASAGGVLVHDIRAHSNLNSGIQAGVNAVISNCTARFNGDSGVTGAAGITTGSGCTVTGCSVSANAGEGIHVTSGCTVSNCTSESNGKSAISATSGSTIAGCNVYNNSRDGVSVTLACVVRGNLCRNNGALDGAGIHAFNDSNRIEDNLCSGADRGIEAPMGGNFIARNTCTGNTVNWSIGAGNACLVVVATPGAAITGDAGGTSPGSTNPNANYTY